MQPAQSDSLAPTRLFSDQTQQGFVDLSTLWQRKWTLIRVTLLACAAGFAFVKMSTPLFESEAKVMVQVDEELLAKQRLDQKLFMENQAQLLQSPIVLTQATERLAHRPTALSTEELDFLAADLSVTPIASTNVLVIGVRGHDADSPVAMLRAVIESYRQLLVSEDQKQAELAIHRLQAEKQSLQQQLAATQEDLMRLRSKPADAPAAIDSIDFQVAKLKEVATERELVERQRKELTQLLHRLPTDSPVANRAAPPAADVQFPRDGQIIPVKATLAAVDRPVSGELLTLVAEATGNKQIAEIQQEMRDAESTLAGLLHRLGPDHPDRVAADRRLAVLQASLTSMATSAVGQLHHQLQLLANREAELEQRHTGALNAVRSATEGQLEEKRQVDRLARLDEMYLAVLAREQQLQQQATEDLPLTHSVQVRVLDEPKLTSNAIWPRSLTLMAVSGCLGLVAGCMMVTFQEGFQRTR